MLDAMTAGGLYSLQVSSPLARPAIILTALATALRNDMPAVLVTTGNPARLLERGRELGFTGLEQAARDDKLYLFSLKEAFARNLFRYGPQRFLQEFEHFGIPKGALIVFDGADELLTLQDPFVAAEQMRGYREWFQQDGDCGLMLFSLLSANSQLQATHQSLLEHLNGAARLESRHEQLEWLVEFWMSPSGVVASRTLAAHIEADGALSLLDAPASTSALPPATDEDDVFLLDSTLVGMARQARGKWVSADNLVGLLHASRNAVAATIVLSYNRTADLRQLAQAVHTLRITLGKRIRIIVRELDASLRYQNELLLLNLGVNMVVHRDVPASRFALTLESLKGQIFSRDIEVDFEAALASVTPTRKHGYLPPALFIREVEDIVSRSKALAVPYALVRMKLPATQEASAAQARFCITRDGDLLTATGDNLYLFLSVCPQVNLLSTLRRLGGDTVEEDFPAMRFAVSETEIAVELAELGRYEDEVPLTDMPLAQSV